MLSLSSNNSVDVSFEVLSKFGIVGEAVVVGSPSYTNCKNKTLDNNNKFWTFKIEVTFLLVK